MASGIPYFPLDVHLDDKFNLIEAEFGLTGFAVVVKLFQKIYGGQGYYCEWTEDVALLFSRNIGLGGNVVSEIVSASIRRGIFDKDIYDKYRVLTSAGIQKRYFEAVSRRVSVDVEKAYLLVQVAQKYKNVNIFEKNVYISSENVYRNKQSKEEKRKEEKSKENNSKEERSAAAADPLRELVKKYEDNIAPITKSVLDRISDWLNSVDADVIAYAIDEAVGHNVRTWKYVEAILNNHFKAGRTTLKEIQTAGRAHKVNPDNLGVYEDNTGFDYDNIEKLMQERYDT